MSGRFWIRVGAISGGVAVALGAFAAHGLKQHLEPKSLEVFETGARYQMYHALAILAVGLLTLVAGSSRGRCVAGWGFLAGTLLFSGSLYALALTQISKLGMITPLGGVAFLVGWVALAVSGFGPSSIADKPSRIEV